MASLGFPSQRGDNPLKGEEFPVGPVRTARKRLFEQAEAERKLHETDLRKFLHGFRRIPSRPGAGVSGVRGGVRFPVLLAFIARHAVDGRVQGARAGYRVLRSELAAQVPPHAADTALLACRKEWLLLARG